jgi:hypothetical protein
MAGYLPIYDANALTWQAPLINVVREPAYAGLRVVDARYGLPLVGSRLRQ